MQLRELNSLADNPCERCKAHPEIQVFKHAPAGGTMAFRQLHTEVTLGMACDCCSVRHTYRGISPDNNRMQYYKVREKYFKRLAEML